MGCSVVLKLAQFGILLVGTQRTVECFSPRVGFSRRTARLISVNGRQQDDVITLRVETAVEQGFINRERRSKTHFLI